AGMAGVQEGLQRLHGCLQHSDAAHAALHAYSLLRGLAETCLTSLAGSAQALHLSLVFSQEHGLLVFIHRSLGIEEFRDCREEALKFLCVFMEKVGDKIHPYACNIKQTCISVYTKERAAKCKVPALELLMKLLQNLRRSCLMEEMKVGDIFNKFYGELATKSKVTDTVLEKIYELLGVLGDVQPSDMINNSEKLFRAYLGELKAQMTSAIRGPKLPVVAGCLRGLAALMCNFTKSVDEDPQTAKEIFDFAVKAINPQVNLPHVNSGLQLFSWHAAQFGALLLDNYVLLFETMCKWCGHTNQELKKASHSALDSFLKQVSLMVAKDVELHKSKLQFFMEQFYGIIRRMDSSSKELSIAIRGYGLFAAPCKAIHSKDVDDMYVELLQRCKQMYLTEAETIDDHLYQLPSFLQSIASVIFHIDTIPEVYTPVLEHLVVLQINSFPHYSEKMQLVCCRSIINVFLSLSGKGPVLWSFISTVVHQGLIRIFSKPVTFSKDFFGKETSGSEESREAGEVGTGRWKVPTYKDYLYLFRSLLSCDTMKECVFEDENFLAENSPLQSLNRLLYDELIKSILKIIEKLDLTVQKLDVNEQDENETDSALVGPSSDPASNLQPTKPTDFIAFINLVEFCREILPEKHVEYFNPWVYSFGYELITHSTRLPLISGFYKLLSVTMKIAKKIKYFEGVSPRTLRKCPEDPEKRSCFALFVKFGKEVAAKMKQYKDELLASCLNFLLSLPHDIIMLDIKAYIPALQNAFKLGLSCTPMADLGLDALEDWSAHIPRHIMQPYYKDVLPLLDGYLKNSTSTVESQNNWEVRKLSRAAQKGFNKVVIQRLRKAKTFSLDDSPSLEAVRARVAHLLGSLGGQINHNLITATSAEEMMRKCVSWDTETHLSFAVPFADMKPVIYLDLFLPRVTELALSASDRQTKVAACELLHGIVTYMLGKASQMPERRQGPPPMYQLHKRIFPVLLRLACDVDQVTRQLYEPLVMQLIHWFTNNKKFESQDTVAFLEAILSGIVDPVDSTLRDFCGQCIQEFLKWSIKQTTPRQQEKSPANTKSLFKRLYSLALHPSAFKRLGAALAFNSIYREFREENSLVEQFVFEALVVFLESLALAHTDEKSLGTAQQCCDTINHLKRIIKHKAPSLNKEGKRRVPRGFPATKSVCLLDIVMWLLVQCGRPQTECRHKAMELFYEFVPLLPGNKSPSSWLADVLKKRDVSFLIKKFEGGGSNARSPSGILSQPTLCGMQEPFSLQTVMRWMDMFLAALDCYNTFFELQMIKPHEILSVNERSSFLEAVQFFLETIALHDIHAAEQCFDCSSKGSMFSPQERDMYNYSKCTIIVRILEFVTMILETCQQDFWKLLEKELLNAKLIELLVMTVCDPSHVGFNTADVQVMKNLPDISVKLMKALMKSPYKESLKLYIKKKITLQSFEDLCSVDLFNSDARFDQVKFSAVLSACKQLQKSGLLHSVLHDQDEVPHFSVGSKLLSAVYKGIAPGGERLSLPSLDISSKRLADRLLQLAFAVDDQCEELVSLLLNTVVLSVPLSGTSQKNLFNFSHGQYFYSLFSETINLQLLKNVDVIIVQLMESSVSNPQMVGSILNGMLDQSFRERTVRKQQGVKLVKAVLRNWKKLDSWWAKGSAPESKVAVLTLLAKVLQIDSSVSFNTNHEAFTAVFNTYTSLLTDQNLGLNLKGQAVIILPFFTNLTGEKLYDLKNALDQLVAFSFPMRSDEFPKGTLKHNNYVDCTKKFLDALELSQSPMLLQLMTEVLCRDHRHFMEDLFQASFKRISRRSTTEKQVILLDTVHKMFQSEDLLSNTTRQAFLDRSLLTLLWHCSLDALREFFGKIIVQAMDALNSRFTKSNEYTFDTQVTKKMGYYKLLEVMYVRLSKEDVYSKDSKINQAYCGSVSVEGNELTKTLIKSCYDAFTENMAGESQLLEKRRQYHCAAYNCAIAVISCVFTEIKFYQGFLFTEKSEKNLLIFENLIDLKRQYTFPIEVEVPLERKKRYIAIRKEARDAGNSDRDEPKYLASASYMMDSSLSEEMSQFDFSTGVQGFSYSSQDVTASSSRFRRKEPTEYMVLNDEMELEMDELNQHECMASMTSLIKHMQRNQITPKVEEAIPVDLPLWMKFLHGKLGNPSVPLNIRLFIAKLILNTEDVFRPYAKHWLGPLLQLVVSGNNGGEGIHYMVVEIVVTILSWTSVTTPKGSIKDEILANRLLEFLMKNAFHQKRAVFRHNLEIIKTVIECWKSCLSIPYSLIFEKFSNGDPDTKDNSVGIQLLGIVLANNLPPFDPKCEIDRVRYFQALTSNMALLKYKEVYAAAAEVLGLALQYIAERENVSELYCVFDC
ncbi:PRKDC kinase, partial [Chordeiles acutipennis]|nr:PRKDC kinase [Chordeiles acutipennis]